MQLPSRGISSAHTQYVLSAATAINNKSRGKWLLRTLSLTKHTAAQQTQPTPGIYTRKTRPRVI